MTKYEELINGWTYPPMKEQFKQELDEVIIEKLHEFVDHYNKAHISRRYIYDIDIELFLQNKEELNVSTNTENPYDLNKFGGLIKNKEE